MAGAVSLSVTEVGLQETRTLLAERHGHEPPAADATSLPWVLDEHLREPGAQHLRDAGLFSDGQITHVARNLPS